MKLFFLTSFFSLLLLITSKEKNDKEVCLYLKNKRSWWEYKWCPHYKLEQIREERSNSNSIEINHIGYYNKELSSNNNTYEYYESDLNECLPENTNIPIKRKGEVFIKCCEYDQEDMKLKRKAERKINELFIDTVIEPNPCHYVFTVCSKALCFGNNYFDNNHDNSNNNDNNNQDNLIDKQNEIIYDTSMSIKEQQLLKEQVKEMFYHGYDSYMKYAFPQSDLLPLTCSGAKFELIKIPLVTLIDTLDTLVILGNYSEFKRAVRLVSHEIRAFNFDVSVSVFETTIRVLGGLLSAHLFAIDPNLQIYSGTKGDKYDGNLLRLAIDVGNRLLPAFRTTTGIPYGTVNLLRGVPKGETELASTAGAGSLLLEFEVLSCLSGDSKYGLAAMKAVEQLYHLRSDIDLVGKHIHIRTGKWHETISGVGSNSDSFYEYLLKSYLLFRKHDHYRMFQDVYYAVKKYSMSGDWFVDVDMYSGKLRNKRSENLQAFWPGMEAILGISDSSARLLNAFYLVWSEVGFLPEEFDYINWSTNGNKGFVSLLYPLRPELIESTYFHYRTTGDRSWLYAGKDFLDSIEKYSKTDCGYATLKDVTKRVLEDNMPSFFLSETCKYLYLLFDEENFIHTNRHYIFTTEAHPIDPVQLSDICTNHLDIVDPKLDKELNEKENESWGDSLLGRVLNTLTGLTEHETDSTNDIQVIDENEDTVDDNNIEFEEHDIIEDDLNNQNDNDGNHDDSSSSTSRNINSIKQKKKKEDELYNDWITGRDLHPHFLQCPKLYWWNIIQYNPGISTILDTESSSTSSTGGGTQTTHNHLLEEARSKFLDISDFLKLIAQKNIVDSFHPTTFCGIDDDINLPPPPTSTPSSPSSSSQKQKSDKSSSSSSNSASKSPEKSIEIEIGELGKFNINIFTDGFIIVSATYGNTIEIAGIGQPTMFVKEYNSTSSSVVIGSASMLSTCNIRLDIDWPTEIWRKKAYNRDFAPEELLKNRCCSHAAFGVTANPLLFPNKPITGNPMKAIDGISCHTPIRVNPETGERIQDPSISSSTLKSSSSWFSWGKKKQKLTPTDRLYDGNIVIADRGGCMFEEKVIQAELSGAQGIIIVNNEPNLFLMSGIKSLERKFEISTDQHDMIGKTNIPAVMISNHDGRFLNDAIQYLTDLNLNPRVVIDLQSFPSVFDTHLMGFGEQTSIQISDNLIHIIGQNKWSVVLSKSQTNEWQLYIVPTIELQGSTPWSISSPKGYSISTNSQFQYHPVGIYKQLISEQCPVDIVWKNNGVFYQPN